MGIDKALSNISAAKDIVDRWDQTVEGDRRTYIKKVEKLYKYFAKFDLELKALKEQQCIWKKDMAEEFINTGDNLTDLYKEIAARRREVGCQTEHPNALKSGMKVHHSSVQTEVEIKWQKDIQSEPEENTDNGLFATRSGTMAIYLGAVIVGFTACKWFNI